MLPLQAEVLDSVFGLKQATVLLEQVTSSLRDRDLLHNNLLQRKSKLQVSRYHGAGRCVLGTDAPPPGEAGPCIPDSAVRPLPARLCLAFLIQLCPLQVR